MKKIFRKKLLSVFVAFSMMFSLCVPALAAEAAANTDEAVASLMEKGAVELTEDTVISEATEQAIVVAGEGITVEVKDVEVGGLVVDPAAKGAKVSVSGAANVPVLVVLAAEAEVASAADTTLGSVIVASADVKVAVEGTAASIQAMETAANVAVTVAETAKVESVAVAAPSAAVEVKGQTGKVDIAETAAGAKLTVAETAKVENVAVAAANTAVEVKGEAGKVDIAETAAGAKLTVAETAKVENVAVAAANVTAEIKGEVTAVEAAETATGLTVDVAADATVGSVVAPADTQVTGEGADKVEVAAPEAPAEEEPVETETPSNSNNNTPTTGDNDDSNNPPAGDNEDDSNNPPPAGDDEDDSNNPPATGDDDNTPPASTPSSKVESANITVDDEETAIRHHHLTLQYTYDPKAGRVTGYTIEWTCSIEVNGDDGALVPQTKVWQAYIEVHEDSENAESTEDGWIRDTYKLTLEGVLFTSGDDEQSSFDDYSGKYQIVLEYTKTSDDETATPEKEKSDTFDIDYKDPLVTGETSTPDPDKDTDTETPDPDKDTDTETPDPDKDTDTETPDPDKDTNTETPNPDNN